MKEILQQKPYLAWLLLLLFLANFVYVPLVDWQDQKKSTLGLQLKKLDKTQNLLLNKDLIADQAKSLEEVAIGYGKILPQFQNETLFKLNKQRWIESLAKSHEIKIQSLGWQAVATPEDGEIKQYQMEVKFQAATKQMVNFQIELEASDELLEIVQYSYNIKRHLKHTMGKASGFINIHFYTEFSGE